jgi:arsenite-transporting ATPase
MGLEETERLYKDLLRLDIPVRRLLVNNVIPPESGRRCEFCSSRRREQVQCLRSYREKFGDLEIFLAPQQPGPIEGPAGLRLHFSNWRRENEK